MSEKTKIKTVSFRPNNPKVMKFLEEYSVKGHLSKNGIIEIALQFLMEWPEEEFSRIVGNSISQERLRSLVEGYVTASRKFDD